MGYKVQLRIALVDELNKYFRTKKDFSFSTGSGFYITRDDAYLNPIRIDIQVGLRDTIKLHIRPWDSVPFTKSYFVVATNEVAEMYLEKDIKDLALKVAQDIAEIDPSYLRDALSLLCNSMDDL